MIMHGLLGKYRLKREERGSFSEWFNCDLKTIKNEFDNINIVVEYDIRHFDKSNILVRRDKALTPSKLENTIRDDFRFIKDICKVIKSINKRLLEGTIRYIDYKFEYGFMHGFLPCPTNISLRHREEVDLNGLTKRNKDIIRARNYIQNNIIDKNMLQQTLIALFLITKVYGLTSEKMKLGSIHSVSLKNKQILYDSDPLTNMIHKLLPTTENKEIDVNFLIMRFKELVFINIPHNKVKEFDYFKQLGLYSQTGVEKLDKYDIFPYVICVWVPV